MNDKSESVHGLLKIPDSVLLKAANIEVGKLKSEVQHLKFVSFNNDETILLRHQVKKLKHEIRTMPNIHSIRQLRKTNKKRLKQIVELKKKLKQNPE